MAKEKLFDETLQQDSLFDETLKKDSITNALGKNSVQMPNSVQAIPTFDALNSTNQEQPKHQTIMPSGIQTPELDEEEVAAQTQGMTDNTLGVYHPSNEEVTTLKKQQRATVTDGTSSQKIGQPTMDWSVSNTTDKTDLDTSSLYKKYLGYTAYEDLKYRCGLSKDDSFTDYYYKTKYIPKGYEKEAKLLLAEEKRMKLYAKCEAGELSATDFLYQAYGKDLLKESGYDFSSPIFWYNRYKNGDYSNPLDNVTILENVINNANTLWQAEKWYQRTQEATLTTSLAGIVTGVKLSDEKVYDLFKNQFDIISEAVDMSTRDIILQYQAGNMGSAFNPFIDIDGDGKFDYYYHLNGKLYAVNGSSGTGDKTCDVKYNYDEQGNITGVKEVEINEGLEGSIGGLGEGFIGFFGSIMDLVSMADNALGIQALVNLIQGDGYFVKGYQEYNAWKSRVFSNNDIVTFDGEHDWGYEISKGIGQVTGQILLQVALAVFTYGAGNAAYTAGELATQAGAAAAKAAIGAAAGAVVGAGAGAIVGGIEAKKNGTEFDAGHLMSGAVIGAGIGAAMFGSSALTQTTKTVDGQVMQTAYGKAASYIANPENYAKLSFLKKTGLATSKILSMITRTNTGAVFNSLSFWGRLGNAGLLGFKDFGNTMYNLHVTNKILEYYEKTNPELDIHPLSNGEILGRAAIAMGVDLAISTSLRLMNEHGLSSFAKNVELSNSNVELSSEEGKAFLNRLGIADTAIPNGATRIKDIYRSLPDTLKSTITTVADNMPKTIFNANLDNVMDIVENVLTMSTSAAVNNPYAKLGSKESFKTFGSAMITPQSIIQNLYITARNFGVTPGSESTFKTRVMVSTFSKIQIMDTDIRNFFEYSISNAKDANTAQALKTIFQQYKDIQAGQVKNDLSSQFETTTDGKVKATYYENTLEAAKFLDTVFDAETVKNLDADTKQALANALGIKETIIVDDKGNAVKKTVDEFLSEIMAQSGRLKETTVGKKASPTDLQSLFFTSVFNRVHKEFATEQLNLIKDTLNSFTDYANDESKVWFDWFRSGKQKMQKATQYMQDYDGMNEEDKRFVKLFKSQWTSLCAQIADTARDSELHDFFSNAKMEKIFKDATYSLLASDVADTTFDRLLDENNGYIKHEVATAMSFFKDKKFMVEQQADGSNQFLWYDMNNNIISEDSLKNNLFYQLLTSQDVINDLIAMGVVKVDTDSNGLKECHFLENNPLILFSIEPEKWNDLLKDDEAKKAWECFHDIAELGKLEDGYGGKLINSDTPILKEYTIKVINSSGEQVERTIYIMPQLDNMNKQTVQSRLSAGCTLIKALIDLKNAKSTQQAIDNALINLGLAHLEGYVDGTNIPTREELETNEEARNEYKLRGILSLVGNATLDNPDDKNVLGINRAMLLHLCKGSKDQIGAISRADLAALKDFCNENKISGTILTKVTQLDSYLEKLEQIQPVLKVLETYANAVQNNTVMTISHKDQERVMNFITDLGTKENSWLYEALVYDNNLNNALLKALITNPTLRLPFLKELKDLAQPLTQRSRTPRNYSNEIENEVLNFLDDTLESYNSYDKVVDKKLATTTLQAMRRYLQAMQTENWEEVVKANNDIRKTIDEYKEQYKTIIKASKQDLDDAAKAQNRAFKDKDVLAKYDIVQFINRFIIRFDNIKQKNINDVEYTTVLNDVMSQLKSIMNLAYDDSKSVADMFDAISNFYNAAGTEEDLKIYRSNINDFINQNSYAIEHMQERTRYFLLKYNVDITDMDLDTDNVIALWNYTSKIRNIPGAKDDWKNFMKANGDLHARGVNLYKNTTAIFSSRSLVKQFFNELKQKNIFTHPEFKAAKTFADALDNYHAITSPLSEPFDSLEKNSQRYQAQKYGIQTLLGIGSDPGEENKVLSAFLKDPSGTLKNIYTQKIKDGSLNEEQKAFYKQALQDLQDEFSDRNTILRITLGFLGDADAIKDDESLFKVLTSEEDSIVKDYVMYALKIGDGDYTSEKRTYKITRNSAGTLMFGNKSLLTALAERTDAVQLFIKAQYETKEQLRNSIVNDLQTYRDYKYTNTTIIENPKVIEVNYLDLIPNNYRKFLELLSASKDYAANTASKALYEDTIKEMQRVLGSFGNLFDTQMNAYLEVLQDCIAEGTFIVRIDCSDENSDAMKAFKQYLNLLGYNSSEYMNALAKEHFIPGVTFKNNNITAIESKVSAKNILQAIRSKVVLTTIQSKDNITPDYLNKLENMFRSSVIYTDDSEIDLYEDNQPIKFVGMFGEGKLSYISRAFEVFNNATKKGLAAGAGSKIHTQINRALGYKDNTELSKQTYYAYKVFDTVKDYFYNEKKSDKSYVITINVPVSAAKTGGLINEITTYINNTPDCLYTLEGDYSNAEVKNGLLQLTFRYSKLPADADNFESLRSKIINGTFDIRKLVPVFMSGSMSAMLNKQSNASVVDAIYQAGIPDYKDFADLCTHISTETYSTDYDEYVKFVEGCKDANGKITIKAIKDNHKEDNKNYYIECLYRSILTGDKANASYANNLIQKELAIFNDRALRRITGDVLNNIHDIKLSEITEDKIKDIAIKIFEKYSDNTERLNHSKENFRTDTKHFSPDINSSYVSKLNINYKQDLTIEQLEASLKALIDLLNFKNSFNTEDFGVNTFYKHNSYLSIMSVFEEDANGNLAIALDNLLQLSKQDIAWIKTALQEARDSIDTSEYYKDFTDASKSAEKKAIDNLIKELDSKLSLLKTMGSYNDAEELTTQIRFTVTDANAPSIIIDNHILEPSDYGLSQDDFNRMVSLQENMVLAKKPFSKFILSTSQSDRENTDNNYSPIIKMYNDMLNNTLYSTVDKPGHTFVYNMNSAEARGSFVEAIIDFSQMLIDNKIIKLEDFKNPQVAAQILTKIALACNLYSTGTFSASEWSGALMISIKDDGTKFDIEQDIKPIITSSSRTEQTFLGELLLGDKTLGDIEKEPNTKHILIKMDKNAFSSSLSGYDSHIQVFDLDNTVTRNNLIQYAIYKAEQDPAFKGMNGMKTSDILLQHYRRTPSTYDRLNHLVKLAVFAGIPESIAKQIKPSISRLSIMQGTKLSDEQMLSFAKQFLSQLNDENLTNSQIQAIKDIFIHGVTWDGLSEDIQMQIKNYRQTLESQASEEIRNIAYTDNFDEVKNQFNSLSFEDKVLAIKLRSVNRHNGGDLEFLLSGNSYDIVRERIADSIKTNNNSTIINIFENGKIKQYDWTQIGQNGNPVKDKSLTPYNLINSGKTLLYDSEWTIGKNQKVYQLAFVIANKGNESSADLHKYNILIRDGFIDASQKTKGIKDTSTGSYYIEDKSTWDDKVKILKDHPNDKEWTDPSTGITYFFASNLEEAAQIINTMSNDCCAIMGYNNTSKGSDDDWLKTTVAGKEMFNRMPNLDIREHLGNSIMTDDKQREALRRDSMDYLKKKLPNVFTKFDKNHDAIYDCINEFEFYTYICKHQLDITNVYDEERLNFIRQGVTEDVLKEALSFKDFNLNVNIDDVKFIADLRAIKKSNAVLKNLIDAYNSSEALRNARIIKKELRNTIHEIILGDVNNPTPTRLDWYNSVKDYTYRNEIQNIVYNIMESIQPNLDTSNEEQIRNTYKTAVIYFDKAIQNFRNTQQIKDEEEKLGHAMGNEELTQRFLSLDIKEQINHLIASNNIKTDLLSIHNSKAQEFFNETNLSYIANEATYSFNYRTQDSLGYLNLKNRYVKQFIEPLTLKLEATGLFDSCPEFASSLINNMFKVYGDYDGSFYDAMEKKRNNLTRFQSKLYESKLDFVKKAFSTEDGGLFASSKALYMMASERAEFTKDDLLRDTGEYGCIYVGDKLLKDAFPTLDKTLIQTDNNGKQFFYTQVWRQPGQGKTMHILKVYIEKGYGLQMTRTTSQSYFNGDFDGDHYFIALPDKNMQDFGNEMFDMTRAGSDLLDLFKDTKLKYDKNTVDAQSQKFLAFTRNHYEQYKAIYEAYNKKDFTRCEELRQQLKTAFKNEGGDDDLWNIYGISNMKVKSGDTYLLSGNRLLYDLFKKDDTTKPYAQLMDNAGVNQIYQNQYTNDFDSQLVGNVAKLLYNDTTDYDESAASRKLYANSINLNSSSITYLQALMSTVGDTEVRNRLINAIDKNNYLSSNNKKAIIKIIEDYNKALTATDLISIAQLVQSKVTNSISYNNKLTTSITKHYNNYVTEYRDKCKALESLCKETIPDFYFPQSDKPIDEMSGPEVLQYASSLLQNLDEYSKQTNTYISTYKNSTYRKLMSSILTDGQLDIKSSRGVDIIGANSTIKYATGEYGDGTGINKIGLTSAKILVLPDTHNIFRQGDSVSPITDTMLCTQYNKLNERDFASVDMRSFPEEVRSALRGKVDVKGSELLDVLTKTKYKNITIKEDADYKICLTDKNILVISCSTSIKDMAQEGKYLKVGRQTQKGGKGTVGYTNITIVTDDDTTMLPDFIMSQSMFDQYKATHHTENKLLTSNALVGDNRENASVFEIDDLALLDSYNYNKLSVSERPEDTISVLQGANAVDAFITMGGTAVIELSGDKIVFNPKGLANMIGTLKSTGKPVASEVNGAKEVQMLKIASIFMCSPKEVQLAIADRLGLDGSLDNILNNIYKIRSLGRDGGRIISAIQNILFELKPEIRNEIISKIRSNDVFNKVWSTRINDSISEYQQTDQDLDNDMWFNTRFSKGEINPHITNMHLDNDLAGIYAAKSGSGSDVNGNNYYGRLQLIEDLTDSHISKAMLENAYEVGFNDMEELVPNSQLNNFHPLLKQHCDMYDKYEETSPQFKTGTFGEVYTYYVNDESDDAYLPNLKDFDTLDMSAKDYRNLYFGAQERNDDGSYKINFQNAKGDMVRDMYIQKYMTPFFTDGSDAMIADTMSNNEYKMSGMINTPTLELDKANVNLQLGSYHRSKGEVNIQEYSDWITEETKNATNAKLFEQKANSAEFKLSKQDKFIDNVTGINNYLKGDSLSSNETLKRLFEQYKDFTNPQAFKGMEYYLDNNLTEEDYIKAINLWAKDNHIDVESSFFNSAGIKSKGNVGIDLENRVLYLNTLVDTKLNNILGIDFKFLVKITKDSPILMNILNKYMDIKYKLDIYNTLNDNKRKYIKQYGEYAYNNYLTAAKKLVAGDQDFDTMYTNLNTQLAEIEKNSFVDGMLKAVNTLNLRLNELAQKDNPLALIGYYIPQYESVQKDINLLPKFVESNKCAKDTTRELLNGYKKNPDGSYSFVTSIYTSKDGYLGMITKIAQQYAVTEAMKDFSDFLKNQGYMRNLDTNITALDTFYRTMQTTFLESFLKLDQGKTKLNDLNETSFNILRDKYNSLVINNKQTLSNYVGAKSFIDLYTAINNMYTEALDSVGVKSSADLLKLYQEAQQVSTELNSNTEAIRAAIDAKELYECTIGVMLGIMEDNGERTQLDFLKSLYIDIAKEANDKGCVLVDSRGAILDPSKNRPCTTTLDINDIIQEAKMMYAGSKEAEIAKMALLGDVYMMRKSVADQLDSKVFTKRIPGIVGEALNTARSYVTSFLMANPLQVLDRKINFTMFDIGTLMGADIGAMKYLMPSIATIEKYVMNPDAVTEEAINSDMMLQLLLRYMAASGQTPTKATNFYGEEIKSINIPVIKQVMSLVSKELAKQQFYARFAYFCDLCVEGEINDFNLNPQKFGVAFHKQKGLKNIQAAGKDNIIYNSLFNSKEQRLYNFDQDGDYLQKMINMDAAALQVVAENVGVFGNMPYGAGMLSKLGMMFTGFPLAAMRWGVNRIQSLGYAITNLGDKSTGSWGYLVRNTGSTLITATILLALQILMSPDTKKYLNKRIHEGKSKEETKDELGDTSYSNAENILFRGGCIKPFQSWLQKEETTNTGHSRDAMSYLWNSFVADFFLKDEDETAGDAFWNIIRQNLWGHTNILIKDIVESIPGNTALQTYNWFQPEDNFFENLGRKATGYVLGSAQSTAIWDNMKASKYEDEEFLARLGTGFKNAYIDSFANTKEYKSSWKNYKKAFSIIHDYLDKTGTYENSTYDTSDTYTAIKKELNLALKEKSSPNAFYNIIEKYLDKGTSLSEVKSAVSNCSIRKKLMKLDSIEGLEEFLTDSEIAVIKSALAYEDYMFPYLTNYIEDLEDQYYKENKSKNNSYISSVASKLRNYYYNVPTYNSSYNSNYKNYSKNIRLLSNANYNNTNRVNPMSAFQQAQKNINYGLSTDIYGNQTQHYTNGTSYEVRNRGSNIMPGGE